MLKKYILTFDYEIFGSGKGSISKNLIEPTNKILDILRENNVKATFYIEQLEVDAFISLRNKFPKSSLEYKESILIEEQISFIVSQGHDIQLHLHPQWYNASYSKGVWRLNYKWWRFSSLPYKNLADGTPGKYNLIKAGKLSLENLVRKTSPNYECLAFRAGGYNIGADKSSIEALLNAGILLDSSVCPGYYKNSTLSNYDYTKSPLTKTFWYSTSSLLDGNNIQLSNSCIELPLITIKSKFIDKLSIARIVNSISNNQYKKTITSGTNTIDRNIKAITNSNYDVCLSSDRELNLLKNKASSLRSPESAITPIVLIGHPKDFNYFSPLKKIIVDLKGENFITTLDFIKETSNVQ